MDSKIQDYVNGVSKNDTYREYLVNAAKFGFSLAKEDTLAFAEWIGDKQYMKTAVGNWYKFGGGNERYTTEQLYELFKNRDK